MSSELFQRRPMPSLDPPTGASATGGRAPTAPELEPAVETPSEAFVVTEASKSDALPMTPGALAAEPALVATPARGESPTIGDFSALTAAIESASAIDSPYERLVRLADVYDRDVHLGWDQFAAAIESSARAIGAKRDTEREPVLAAYANDAGTIAHNLSAHSEKTLKEVAQLRHAQESFVQESTGLVKEVWRRIGVELEIPEPVLSAYNPPMGTGGEIVSTGDYALYREQLEQLKGFLPFGEDPAIRNALPWIAGVTFVVVGVNFGSFAAGLFAGLWAAAGVLIWRHWRRASAKEAFGRLVELTPFEQGVRLRAMEARITDLEQRAEKIAADCEERRCAAESVRDIQLAEIDSRFEAPITSLREHWNAGREDFAGRLHEWGLGIESALALQPARLGPWTTSPAPDAPLPNLADQLRVRLGYEETRPLRNIDQTAASLIHCAAEPPPLPAVPPPVFFDLGEKRSLLIYSDGPAGAGASTILTTTIARMLMQLPPGKLHLTLFDPVGLGRSYSAFLKLSDYSDLLINGKVWSEKDHIRRKLKELIEHIETVTQKYLRADFADIETYNANAGEIAEAYKLLVISDFPEGFDEDSVKDLIRIVQNGARCGVFALVHVNRSSALPYGVTLDPLEKFCSHLAPGKGDAHQFINFISNPATATSRAVLVDAPPPAAVLDPIVKAFGEGAQAAKAVEVPFRQMLERAKIPEDQWWERSAKKGIEVPLGPTGAKKVQMLSLGTGLAHHALLVGRPGSGKSNLIHVFISTLARLYSPAEVQLYLVDFKKGVEFKPYAEALLPHARVIAVESEREFGLSVMQGLDEELKRRGELFREAGTASYTEYRQKGHDNFPRIVLIVDEFQEFFSRDDRISRECTTLFDRLVRQGRAFGIHLVLGTQSLANAGLQKATQDQMAVRIALQCSEADSRLILAEDNLVARSLTRPGEAIYNAAAGLIEGNSQFQVAMFSEEDRHRELGAILKTAKRKKWEGEPPVIFEGHGPADIACSRPLMTAEPRSPGHKLELWLGEPIALKPPVTATLARQSGRNMLVLTRDEQQGVAVTLATLCAIAAQSLLGDAIFRIVDLTAADAEWADHPEAFADAVPHDAEVLGKRDLRTLLPNLEALIAKRTEDGAASEPSIVLAVIGLHRARDLRNDETAGLSMSFDAEPPVNLAQCFEKILQDGPDVGVHTVLWCDSFGNLDRVVDRRGLNEIGLRVSGSLSPGDSHRLFDDEVAAGIDNPYRLVKFDDEHVGVFELFRPYSLPTAAFFRAFATKLRSRDSSKGKEKQDG